MKGEIEMKKLSDLGRVTGYLNKIFRAVNQTYFENSLETPIITVQSSVGAYGHLVCSKIWYNAELDKGQYELNIGAEHLTRPIEEVTATIIHECTHLYCLMHNIQDTSNRGIYHNKKFKQIAEEKGKLKIERHDVYGWTLTSPTEETMNFCIENGFEDIAVNRGFTFNIGKLIGGNEDTKEDGENGEEKPKTKTSSTRKYICPHCHNSFRATKDINVICGDCNVQFVLA